MIMLNILVINYAIIPCDSNTFIIAKNTQVFSWCLHASLKILVVLYWSRSGIIRNIDSLAIVVL